MFSNPRFDLMEDIARNPSEFHSTMDSLKAKYKELGRLNFRKLV